MARRTDAQLRRELLAALRRLRDEGPTKRHFGIFGNLKPLILLNQSEFFAVSGFYNEMVKVYGKPFPHQGNDKWVNNPKLISILHRMITHMENQTYYLGTDL